VRLGDLRDFDYFEDRFRNLVAQMKQSHPDLEVDVEKELDYYRSVRQEVVLMTTDTIEYINQAILENKKVLVEGEGAICVL
jgi:adenylosuccinate synthase